MFDSALFVTDSGFLVQFTLYPRSKRSEFRFLCM